MAADLDRPRRNSSPALKVALAAATVAGAVGWQNTAQAGRIAPWCAAQGGKGGGFDCSYYTFEQCMETARGLGNFCTPNPNMGHVENRERRRRK